MKKRVLLIVLLLLLPVVAMADMVSGEWQYALNEDGRAVVTKYLGSARDVQMPWNVDGHIIMEIGEEAFAGNNSLTSIKLSMGAAIIRMNAFQDCIQLREVTLPTMLETIEDGAFAGCTALEVIEIPNSVAEIGEAVFEPSTALCGSAESLAPGYAAACGLRYAASPEALTADGNSRNNAGDDFQYEIRSDSVVITSYIGDDYEVVVPAEIDGYPVRVIGTNAFSSRYEVERVILPEGLIELERTAFRKCPSLMYIELPSTLKYIRDNAFYQCENLSEITIPAGVESLGDRAFTGCTQLRHVTIYAQLQSMRTYTFYDCHPTLTIYAPEGSVAARHARTRGYRFVAID